jgi:hypothetical protein
MNIMKLIYLLLITLLLTSCGSSFHVKRAKWHMMKAESMGVDISRDTVVKEVKLKIDGINVRFIPKPIFPNGDTIYFEKERVVTKVLLRHDSIFVETNCPDTVYHFKERTITKTVTAINSSWLKWWYLLIALAVGLIVGVLKR